MWRVSPKGRNLPCFFSWHSHSVSTFILCKLKARFNGFNICPTFVQQKLNRCWANVGQMSRRWARYLFSLWKTTTAPPYLHTKPVRQVGLEKTRGITCLKPSKTTTTEICLGAIHSATRLYILLQDLTNRTCKKIYHSPHEFILKSFTSLFLAGKLVIARESCQ